MLSRKQLCTAGLLAVFVLGTVGAASAFAEGPVWEVKGKVLKAGEQANVTGKGFLAFVTTVLGKNLKIECKKLDDEMTLKGGEPGTDEDRLKYSECKVTEPSGCKTAEDITLETNTTLVFLIKSAGKWVTAKQAEWEAAGEKGYGDKFVGKVGGVITTVEVTGCALEGEYELKGSYTGLVNKGLEFISELDSLTFGTAAAVATGFLEYEAEIEE